MQIVIYMLVSCLVLNNSIQVDKCILDPGRQGAFKTSEECWTARAEYARIMANVPPEKTKDHGLIQWRTEGSGPYTSTATCIEGKGENLAWRFAP